MKFGGFEKEPERRHVKCRDTLISLYKEESVAPAGNSFVIAMGTLCFVLFVVAMVFLSRS